MRAGERRWRHLGWRHLALAGTGCAALALVAAVDPARTTLGPPCPLRAVTGLDCPLCGATRATHQLLRGDVAAALELNALYVVALPVVLALVGWWAIRGRLPAFAPRLRWVAITAVFAFFILRNLPWEPMHVFVR